jgi:cobalt/nickel transport system permease protein
VSLVHIPDNYLSPATCAVMGAAMAPVWTVAVRRVSAEVEKARIPLLGIGAAFAFLLMMFNVPLPGGTTGHAVGGTFLAVVLGPWSACLSLTIALLLQALLFGDGGILAFGANAFTMAFVIPFAGYGMYKLLMRIVKRPGFEPAALAAGSYLAINLGALAAAVLLGMQPLLARDSAGFPLYCPYPLSIAIPAMLAPHLAVAGVVEAIFTVALVAFIRKAAPGMIRGGDAARTRPLVGALAGLAVLSPLGLLAAGTAWGEWGPGEIAGVVSGGAALGFVPSGMKAGFTFSALIPDYAVAGLPPWSGYVVSALAGGAILVILFKLLSLLVGAKGDM